MNAFELILFAVLGFTSFTSFFLVGMRTTWADSKKRILVVAFGMAAIVFVALLVGDNSTVFSGYSIAFCAIPALASIPANLVSCYMGGVAVDWQQENPSKPKLVWSYVLALLGASLAYAALVAASLAIILAVALSGCEGECF